MTRYEKLGDDLVRQARARRRQQRHRWTHTELSDELEMVTTVTLPNDSDFETPLTIREILRVGWAAAGIIVRALRRRA